MKKVVSEFFKRGLIAAAGGPVVLAIVYSILGAKGVIESLTVREACLGIFTSVILAFIAAGSGAVYVSDRLPLPTAALIQGALLYVDYILIYLINGWLQSQWSAVAVFTAVFVIGYALIWLIIYLCTRSSAKKLNQKISGN